MISVEINPNLRTAAGETYLGIEEFSRVPSVGEEVEIYQPDYGIRTAATVTNVESQLVFLRLDWLSFVEGWPGVVVLEP